MKVQGYCDGCHKFKRVNISAHQLSIAMAKAGRKGSVLLKGTCDQCEESK